MHRHRRGEAVRCIDDEIMCDDAGHFITAVGITTSKSEKKSHAQPYRQTEVPSPQDHDARNAAPTARSVPAHHDEWPWPILPPVLTAKVGVARRQKHDPMPPANPPTSADMM